MTTRPYETRPSETKGKETTGERTKPQSSGGSLTPSRQQSILPLGGFEPFYRLREEFNRMLDRYFPGHGEVWPRDGWGLDVQEDDAAVTVRAEAPGFEPNDFDIQVRGDQLVLRAAHRAENEEKDSGYHEWRHQEFFRSVPMPGGIDREKVEAAYRNGILNVTLPKTEQAKGRRIEVKP